MKISENKITAEEWLRQRKWKKFLMAVPLNKPKGYHLENSNDLMTLRVRATQLNKDTNCDRNFSVTIDFDTKVATITTTNKYDQHKTTDTP